MRQHGDLVLGEIGKIAGADQAILAAGDIGFALGPHLADRGLDRSGLEGLVQPALALDLLEQAPGDIAQRIGERFDGAGARGGIGDAMNIGLFDQDRLRVAGDAARERVGQPERRAERQHGDGIGAADRSAERGDGAAHDVAVRIALGHHAPRGLGGDEAGPRRKPACLLDTRP